MISLIARQIVFGISDHLEDGDWLVYQYGTVFAHHFENVTAEFVTASAVPFGRTNTFCFLIKEPLIDFDPLQAGLCHGLILGFSSHLSVVFFMDLLEND